MTAHEPADEEFAISSRPVGQDAVLVEIAGDLDMDTVPRATTHLCEATRNGPQHLIVDLSGVRFLASTGMSLLVSAHTHDHGIQGHLHLLGVTGNHPVERPLSLVALIDVFDIAPDLPTVLATIGTT